MERNAHSIARLPALFGILLLTTPGVLSAGEETAQAKTTSLFDGKTLDGWEGDSRFWSVRDGTITGQTTAENPTEHNTFLIWQGGTVGDFELTLEYKIVGGNSGIQYRSQKVPGQKWVMTGHQADFEAGDNYSGIHYEEKGRGILAQRGQKTVIQDNGKPNVVEQFAESQKLQGHINKKDWNTYTITAKGQTFTHAINGHVTSIVIDKDEDKMVKKGLLALQLHAGPPMIVQFRDIRLKTLDGEENTSQSPTKKILFIAGGASHGYATHEHRAGCLLLAEALANSNLPVKTQVIENGWPQNGSVLKNIDALVIYADGGRGHPAVKHLDTLRRLSEEGTGIACLHYAVEVPKGKAGQTFLQTIGGYFEKHWSVNPHWTAGFDNLPDHPITRSIEPFEIRDEWYYHMRFRSGTSRVKPILTDLPPDESLSRPDGAHSGNPAVREAIASGTPQHVAWVRERAGGGRGFGFTGGHIHWNWGHDEFRQLVLNAIAWTAHLEVPSQGIPVETLTVSDLEANQDEPQPPGYNSARIQSMLDEWNR